MFPEAISGTNTPGQDDDVVVFSVVVVVVNPEEFELSADYVLITYRRLTVRLIRNMKIYV